MVCCYLWTPTGRAEEAALPETRNLAQRLGGWDFVKEVVWVGQPPSWWDGKAHPCAWTDRRGWIRSLLEASTGEEHLFLVPGDAPLLREDLCREVWRRHREQNVDYTFADCFPQGLAGEAVSRFALEAMASLELEAALPDRGGLFTAILPFLNAFDVETVLSPRDFRPERVAFFDDGPAARLLIRRFLPAWAQDLENFLEAVWKGRVEQRTLPAYWKLQITEAVRSLPSYGLPLVRPQPPRHLDLEELARWARSLAEWMGGGYALPGFWGEVSSHPQPVEALLILANAGFQLVVETSGLGWNTTDLERLAGEIPKLTWIVELDALEAEQYRRLRGEGFEEAWATATALRELFPGRVYLQAVRYQDTEETIEDFYRRAREEGFKPLVVGYSSFAGRLPDRRTVDLSPYLRRPCWHLQRGIHTLVDGRVVACHQFPEGDVVWGNLREESPATIWARGEEWMRLQSSGEYPQPCRSCDEYYRFVF